MRVSGSALTLTTVLAFAAACGAPTAFAAASCDKACMEHIADQYRAAYLKHDPALAPLQDAPAPAGHAPDRNAIEDLVFPDLLGGAVTHERVIIATIRSCIRSMRWSGRIE